MTTRTPRRLGTTFLALALLSTPCFAYLDPGTSAALFQVGQVVLTTIISALVLLFRPLQQLYWRIRGKLGRGAASAGDAETPSAEAPAAEDPLADTGPLPAPCAVLEPKASVESTPIKH
jgi:hypothetical protein